jgi:hypothetical protein
MSIAELLPAIQALQHADKIRLMDFLVSEIAIEEGISLANRQSVISESVDALQLLAGMAQPMGPENLARNFDHHVGRVLSDESAQ